MSTYMVVTQSCSGFHILLKKENCPTLFWIIYIELLWAHCGHVFFWLTQISSLIGWCDLLEPHYLSRLRPRIQNLGLDPVFFFIARQPWRIRLKIVDPFYVALNRCGFKEGRLKGITAAKSEFIHQLLLSRLDSIKNMNGPDSSHVFS